MKKFSLAVVLLSVVFAAGCGSSAKVVEQKPESTKGKYFDYYIGVGDQISINVWRNEDLSLEVPVRPDGKISMPLVGEVVAAGNTAQALSDNIKSSLENYIRNPQVTVIVTDALSSDYQRRVRVTGAVEDPISIPQREGMTVLDLVLEAGGLTEFAIPNKAKLYRKTSQGVVAYPIYLGDILNKGKLETNFHLAPSDIISIPERVF